MTHPPGPALVPIFAPASIHLAPFEVAGAILAAIVVLLAAFVAALPWIAQPFVKLVMSVRYNFRVIGRENIPKSGPVLLVSNHLSWFDGFFLAANIPRKGTALVNSNVFGWPVVGFLARRCGLISVPYSGPKAQRAAIETCRKVLDDGGFLAIFPEAQLTRTGMTAPFHRGLELILAGREQVAVIPVYLDNVWGSVTSFSGGRFFTKWPKGLRRTVVVSFGPAIGPPVTAFAARQAVLVAGVTARSALARPPARPETIDPERPHFDHPSLGPLTASTADVVEPKVPLHQVGHKPGTIGHPLPGVAIRIVDEEGKPLGPDTEGRIQALVPCRAEWSDIGYRGRIDPDGFVTLVDATDQEGPKAVTA